MRRVEWIHERLEIGSPPLSDRVCNLPLIIDTLSRELSPRWRQALIEARFETFNLVFTGVQVIPWSGEFSKSAYTTNARRVDVDMDADLQLEERIRNLQHQDVRVVVLVAD